MFVVISMFDDLQDATTVQGIRSYHRYKPGDTYPREGYTPTSERVRSLLTGDNAQHRPLIAIPKPPEQPASEEGTATEAPELEKAEKPAAKPRAKRTAAKKPSSANTSKRVKE